MTVQELCPDCAVEPGKPHVAGCDVARCKTCGWQDIGFHPADAFLGAPPCPDDRPMTTWTGRWPGDVEVEEYGLTDLNDLMRLAASQELRWNSDRERWFR